MCLWLSVQICSVCNAFAAKAPNMLAQRADLIMSVFLKLVIREEVLVYQALQKHIWALWALYNIQSMTAALNMFQRLNFQHRRPHVPSL